MISLAFYLTGMIQRLVPTVIMTQKIIDVTNSATSAKRGRSQLSLLAYKLLQTHYREPNDGINRDKTRYSTAASHI
ncbi:MAG: hypothetical protein ACI9B9_000507 [Halioglobus sp.]|jgi:hypothetical protein